MLYFNNLFICSYRIYKRLEKGDAGFKASLLIWICFVGILFFACVFLMKEYNIKNTPLSFLVNYPVILIGAAIGGMFLLNNYYSTERINLLNTRFEEKSMMERRLWGHAVILTLVVPYVAGALLLNK